MFKRFTLFFLLACLSIQAQTSWVKSDTVRNSVTNAIVTPNPLLTAGITSISYDKANGVLLAGTGRSTTDTCHGIFSSTDLGKSWYSFNSGFALNKNRGIYVFAHNYTSAGIAQANYIAGTTADSVHCLFKSSGVSSPWSALVTGIPALTGFSNFVDCDYAIYAMYSTTTVQVARSLDKGNTWVDFYKGMQGDVGTIAVAGSTLLATSRFYWAPPSKIAWIPYAYYLLSGDTAWRNTGITKAFGNTIFSGFAVHGATVLMSVEDTGRVGSFYRSSDNGRTWGANVISVTGLPVRGASFPTIKCTAVFDSAIYAAVDTFGIYCSTDDGNTWTAFNTGLPFGKNMGMGLLFVQGTTLFAGTIGQGIWRRELVAPVIPPAVPAAPALVLPVNGAVNTPLNVKLVWSKPTGSTAYRLQLSLKADFTSLVKDSAGMVDTFFTTSKLLNDTPYYWRVCASNTGGASPWSVVSTFTTDLPLTGTEMPLVSHRATVNAVAYAKGFMCVTLAEGSVTKVLLTSLTGRCLGTWSMSGEGVHKIGIALPAGIHVCRLAGSKGSVLYKVNVY